MKYVISIVLFRDTCERTGFLLCMVLDMTKLYCLIPALMTLMFTQCHRFKGNLEFLVCSCSCVKPHEAAEMFRLADYEKEMTVKKSCAGNMGCLSICSSC